MMRRGRNDGCDAWRRDLVDRFLQNYDSFVEENPSLTLTTPSPLTDTLDKLEAALEGDAGALGLGWRDAEKICGARITARGRRRAGLRAERAVDGRRFGLCPGAQRPGLPQRGFVEGEADRVARRAR